MKITEQMVVAVMNVARENMRSIGAAETRQMLEAALASVEEPLETSDEPVAFTKLARDMSSPEGWVYAYPSAVGEDEPRIQAIVAREIRRHLEGDFTQLMLEAVRQETQERLREWVPGLVNDELREDRLRLSNLTQLVDVTRKAVRHIAFLNKIRQTGWGQHDVEQIDAILDGER
jgi:hypothetical protein